MEAAKVLVVDDEPSILRLLREALAQWGYQVATASNAREALDALRTDLYDAAITDIRMPEMDGADTFRALRNINPRIKAILMSGCAMSDKAQSILDEGAIEFVQKPFDTKEFLEKITAIVSAITAPRHPLWSEEAEKHLS